MKKARILVVDDDPNIRKTVRQALEVQGYEVRTANDGRQALELQRAEPFDVLLLDMRMPRMDGLETISALHVANAFPRIVLMTAFGHIDEVAQGLRHGAMEFLQKPFTPQSLREAVARLLQLQEAPLAPETAYLELLEQARSALSRDDLAGAEAPARRAQDLNPSRPEAFNLLGIVADLRNEWLEAAKNYRTALELDPSYTPAKKNLDRALSADWRSAPPDLG
jgi:two-component system, OmpR family, alkaline phosphatase synthesis response regulator PhoP